MVPHSPDPASVRRHDDVVAVQGVECAGNDEDVGCHIGILAPDDTTARREGGQSATSRRQALVLRREPERESLLW